MRIVQAIETAGPGGAEKLLIGLCCGLLARGHAVRALLLRRGWLAGALENAGVAVTVLPLKSALDRTFASRLRESIGEFRCDVLHSHEFTLGIYGRLATRGTGVSHVATAHGANFARGLKRKIAGGLLLRESRRFGLVAVSDSLADGLSRSLRMKRSAVRVIPNGIPLSKVPSHDGRGDGTLRLLAVGNLYPVKNHALLVRAMGILVSQGLDAKLDVLGRGDEEANLRSLVEELDLGEHVVLHGFCENIAPFLSRADVFVSSSVSEGMPLSFLEAMGAGLPIVASRVGGVAEIVQHGHHGLLFESGDVEGLVGALRELAATPGTRERMGREARSTVESEFAIARTVARYETMYRNLTNKGA